MVGLRLLRRAGAQVPEFLVDGFDGNARGRPAARVPAHAVGDDVELQLVVDEEAVLVVVALAADVRQARRGGLQTDRDSLSWGTHAAGMLRHRWKEGQGYQPKKPVPGVRAAPGERRLPCLAPRGGGLRPPAPLLRSL